MEDLQPCIKEGVYYARSRQQAAEMLGAYVFGASFFCERIQGGEKCQYFEEAFKGNGKSGQCIKPREEWANPYTESETSEAPKTVVESPYEEFVLGNLGSELI